MKYNGISRLFHWVMAVVIIGLLSLGLYMTNQDFTPQIGKFYGWHKATGFLVLVAAVLRVLWRFKHKVPDLPADMKKIEKLGAKGAHFGLYALMFIMPLSGWAMSSAYGFPVSVFGWFTLPSIAPESKELAHFMGEVHEYAGFTLIALIVLHLLAGLYHHFFRKDDVLRRMLMVMAFVGASVLLSAPAKAADWAFDPDASSIEFTATVNHAPSKGAFTHITPALSFTPENVEAATGSITVDLTQIDAAYPMVATTLQQKDWFDTAKWPTAHFEIVGVQRQKCPGCYLVTGNLKLRATTLPFSVDVRMPAALEGNRLEVTGKGQLSRTAYGIGQGEWVATDVVADEIVLNIKAVFTR